MPGSNNIITIDGPAGSGKGTVARMLADEIGYSYLDTGAMYRTVALAAAENSTDIKDEAGLKKLLDKIVIDIDYDKEKGLKVYLDGSEVSEKIRSPQISGLSSDIAKKRLVREYLVSLQRKIGLKGNIVVEGRDMGTYVFPKAKFKFFLDATPEERANRRYKQLKDKNKDQEQTYNDVLREIKSRDKQDMERKESPLHPALNAVIIDTTSLTPSEVVVKIINITEAA